MSGKPAKVVHLIPLSLTTPPTLSPRRSREMNARQHGVSPAADAWLLNQIIDLRDNHGYLRPCDYTREIRRRIGALQDYRIAYTFSRPVIGSADPDQTLRKRISRVAKRAGEPLKPC